ncbi:MAG: DUF3531 family protein [Aphanocapsa feldmannii 277cV]|uniref:DUF3531 family protein n=2 Tax=Aphanocapsa feldmannii TaxID=192050 RepID=A0A524RKV4_9CHRO|nr:MAG: DUF3531 family protein [Aphanocapsa feldmannii 288cV]TGG90498.1 MAG: DUF3531 family protein [Aphanocapsa feldmannii 277cV]TGH27560.1 MAG: DUF3531 family protein [Aphanocapsa feldmannii 277cI]
MQVSFRSFDPFDCWIWVQLSEPLRAEEKPYLEEVFDSWYYLGKLGAFNADNLQVHNAGAEISWMHYDRDEAGAALAAVMHNKGELETKQEWCRCWFDLGTSDGVALDLLINALATLNSDIVEVRQVVIGGVNPDWPVDGGHESFVDPDA